ncbi:DNA helicase PIF1, ATP-dependent [Tanacetum coccineum]|uniref:DNA helicase PIF1, ATP-dependent n=1 Tax=Tanacetum coccineum TaxID=301880 RepID=A0ABQ5BKY1_9ASTR
MGSSRGEAAGRRGGGRIVEVKLHLGRETTQLFEAKERGIFLIKNFAVRPNKDEFWVFRHDMFMLEFDRSTTIRKVSANSVGFVRYTFQLVDFDDIELINNKYMIGPFVMIPILCARGKSLRVTLWGGVGDSLIEKKTAHVGMCAIVLTSMTAKTYNNKLYLLSTSSTVIYDIPSLHELKSVTSLVEPQKEMMMEDSSQPREGTVENLLVWARNHKNDVCTFVPLATQILGERVGGTIPPMVERNVGRVSPARQESSYARHVTRLYRLEVIVVDDTTQTVVVMFNEIATELLNCSADSLIEAKDKSVEDDSSLPTAIRNLIGTTHVMELKSHTYYEYGSYESFTCWKINPTDLVDDGASSSNQLITLDDSEPSFKRLERQASMCTPSKLNEEKRKKRSELKDFVLGIPFLVK